MNMVQFTALTHIIADLTPKVRCEIWMYFANEISAQPHPHSTAQMLQWHQDLTKISGMNGIDIYAAWLVESIDNGQQSLH